ncbi:MAG TPA: GxxExxY protein [Flavisolibacter sp.]|nr:GxxExxY protein [Flavisolibacter sp.]
MKHEEITNKIIQAFFKVYNTLGYGFLEKVYRNALYIELIEMKLAVSMEKRIQVYYKTHVVGDFCSDIIVEDVVICELKTNENISEADENQLINYLKSTNIEVGLLLNFGKKPEVKRKVYDNEKKTWHTTRISQIDKTN